MPRLSEMLPTSDESMAAGHIKPRLCVGKFQLCSREYGSAIEPNPLVRIRMRYSLRKVVLGEEVSCF